jgi:hypothetical protein
VTGRCAVCEGPFTYYGANNKRETCSRPCRAVLLEKRRVASFWSGCYAADDGCWPWKRAKPGQYGTFKINGKNHPAHRLSSPKGANDDMAAD